MRITPLDVRKQEFRKAVRGFDCDEVRAFLTTLADEYEAVLVDNKQIRERLLEQEEQLADYLKMERNLRDTLMTAERVMQETRENANREGALIVKDAEMKARGVLEECRLRTEELRREIVGLRKEKETYLARFRSLAEAQIQFIDTHRSDFEDLDRRLVDIVDSVVTRTGTARNQDEIAARPATRHAKPYAAPAAPSAATAPQAAPAATPVPAPAPADERDIWRDYLPGAHAKSAPAPASAPPAPAFPAAHAQPAPQPAPAAAPASAPAVDPWATDEPAADDTAFAGPAPAAEENGDADLNHLLAETLAEVEHASPENVALELASRGIPVPARPAAGDDLLQAVTEVANI